MVRKLRRCVLHSNDDGIRFLLKILTPLRHGLTNQQNHTTVYRPHARVHVTLTQNIHTANLATP